MSVLTSPSSSVPSSAPRVLWAHVESGLWVATRAGSHLGRVEREGARYHAWTGRGVDLGRFAALADAQQEITARA